MAKMKIVIKKRSGAKFRKQKNLETELSPEKARKIEEIALARQKSGYAPVDFRREPKDRDRFLRKFIEWGIIGLLIFSPLPAASVPEWSKMVIQLTVLLMFGAYLLMKNRPQINPHLSRAFKWPRIFFGALFILLCIQILPLPNFLGKVISPGSHVVRALFSPDFGKTHFMGLSLIPSHTFQEGLLLLTYFLLGYLIIKMITRQKQIKRIIYVLIGMAVFQSLYGFFELYSRNPRILLYEKKLYLDAVTGTFINRNHLSGIWK